MKSGHVTLVVDVSREKMMEENVTVPLSEGAMVKMEEAEVIAETVFVGMVEFAWTVKERVKEVETVSVG